MARSIAAGLFWAGLLTQAGAQNIFTCVDAKGRRLTADRPIADCNDREQREISSSGTVLRKIGPSLTAEERAAEEEKQRKITDERNRQLEEKKRDRALLTRYPEKAVHDKERAAALSTADEMVNGARKHSADLIRQRKRLETELEFFKGDPSKAPAKLKREAEVNQQELEAQERFLARQEQEKARINARYDEELARLKQLWALRAMPVSSASAPAKR